MEPPFYEGVLRETFHVRLTPRCDFSNRQRPGHLVGASGSSLVRASRTFRGCSSSDFNQQEARGQDVSVGLEVDAAKDGEIPFTSPKSLKEKLGRPGM